MNQVSLEKEWFQKSRFGLFIHWGLYSLPARHEWVRTYEEISQEVYDDKYLKHFNPDLYNPEEWAEMAVKAGMKYVVLTVKHHDGFCLWNSKWTDYTAVNTSAGRDLLAPFLEAFRKKGIKVGLYYSLLDWHHGDFVIDQHHPSRNDEEKKLPIRDQNEYSKYLYNQVEELMTCYGHIDILWFDFSYPDSKDPKDFSRGKGIDAWRSERLVSMIKNHQPHIILNDRHGLDDPESWDFKTPEQFTPKNWYQYKGEPVVWEACQTFSGSWGYYRDQNEWRSTGQVLSTLIRCVSLGGNLLMNIGPNGRGAIDSRAVDRLSEIGEWMRLHSSSIYGCTAPPEEYKTPENCLMTYNPEKGCLYVHILDWPYKHLHLEGSVYGETIEYAQLLNDASEIPFHGLEEWQEHAALDSGFDNADSLTLLLPQQEPDVLIPVVELYIKKIK